ncbi:MAG TPA: hypothetical protein VFH42_01360 [Sporolactobacillaceae bacterium]|nr:hypothetical protein [Sporolactobacillaceae bacterium]
MVIESKSNRHSKSKNINDQNREVIRVPKVYDWVTDSITVTKEVFFEESQREAIEIALADPRRRPIRLVARPIHDHNFFCEQLGDKRDVVVPIDGALAEIQQVVMMVNSDIEIQVLDRHGDIITDAFVEVAELESFVLIYPNGTELFGRLREVLAEITSGSVILNDVIPHSFDLKVTLTLDVQVEAEVNLEIPAQLASPRENIIDEVEGEEDRSAESQSPDQFPDIMPEEDECVYFVTGEASGLTDSEFEGTAKVVVNIDTFDSPEDSVFEFTFKPTSEEKTLIFIADSFEKESFHSKDDEDSVKLIVGGSGLLGNGHMLNFKAAFVDSEATDQYQVRLMDPENGNVLFDTGIVNVNDGELVIWNNQV